LARLRNISDRPSALNEGANELPAAVAETRVLVVTACVQLVACPVAWIGIKHTNATPNPKLKIFFLIIDLLLVPQGFLM
jgi:hypothetical protein